MQLSTLLCLCVVLAQRIFRCAALNASTLRRTAGMVYYTSFDSKEGHWGANPSGSDSWGEPWLSWYVSYDANVQLQHTTWMLGAGIDFVVFDFTNNFHCVMGCNAFPCRCNGRGDLQNVFDSARQFVDLQVQRKLRGEPFLKFTVLIGPGETPPNKAIGCNRHTDGTMQAMLMQIKSLMFPNGGLDVYLHLDNKPLVLWWLANCENTDLGIPFGTDPPFSDPAFTVIITDNQVSGRRQGILDAECASLPQWGPQYSYEDMLDRTHLWECKTKRWSYSETNSPTISYAVDDGGEPFAMTVSAGLRGCSGWTDPQPANVCFSTPKNNGLTLQTMMRLAGRRNVKIVLVLDWNSWTLGESYTMERSNTIEPSKAQGFFYLDLLGTLIAKWKANALNQP